MAPERDDLAESGRQTVGRPPRTRDHPAGAGRAPPRVEQGDAADVGPGGKAREPPPAAGERCSLTVGRAIGTVVVTVRGLLDRASGPVLDRLLVDLIDGQGNQTVVVDLLTATVEGAEGMRPLLAAARRASERGTRFVLNAPSPALWQELVAEGSTVELQSAIEYRLPMT